MALSPSVIVGETTGGRFANGLDDATDVGAFVAERRLINFPASEDLCALIEMGSSTARPTPAKRLATVLGQQQVLPIAQSRTLTGNERSLVWLARTGPQSK